MTIILGDVEFLEPFKSLINHSLELIRAYRLLEQNTAVEGLNKASCVMSHNSNVAPTFERRPSETQLGSTPSLFLSTI